MRIFEYMKRENFNTLPPERQKFMAKMIWKEVKKVAEERNIPEELAYEFYSKGLFGGDREMG